MLDPRTPVIVGAASMNNRGDDADAEPVAMMIRASEAALTDTGSASLRPRIRSVRVVKGIWPYVDPGRLVADGLGLPDAASALMPSGGNAVYDLLAHTAGEIQSGHLDAAIITMAETMRTRRRDRAAGRTSAYLAERDGALPDLVLGSDHLVFSETEAALGVHHPVRFYALAEVALRHELGETAEQHMRRLSEMWARASDVAASNPDAWFRKARSAEEIRTIGPSNRPIAYPYPKLMTSNVNVDQGSAVVLCAAEAAEAAGIPRERWVFPHATAGAGDAPYMTHRWSMCESPGMRIAGARVLDLAEISVDDLALIDLYSCFPVAVQVAQRELGLSAERSFTITGGLTFSGGPMNGYCMQALARAVELVRVADDATTLLSGNGGYFTKHSFLVLDDHPSANGFRNDRPQAEVDALPRRREAATLPAAATIETYTAIYDREGDAERAIIACLTDAGDRIWATMTEPGEIAELLKADNCGRPVRLRSDKATERGTAEASDKATDRGTAEASDKRTDRGTVRAELGDARG